jgi:hypothetical protein
MEPMGHPSDYKFLMPSLFFCAVGCVQELSVIHQDGIWAGIMKFRGE